MIITREMIIGARITNVYSTFSVSDDLDFYAYYFLCDGGFSFCLPCGGSEWETESIPDDAKELNDRVTQTSLTWRLTRKVTILNDRIWRLKQQHITGVFCGPFNPELGFYEPWDTIMVMSDGSLLYSMGVAPHGTGGAGLYYVAPSDSTPSISQMDDYFTIPIEDQT